MQGRTDDDGVARGWGAETVLGSAGKVEKGASEARGGRRRGRLDDVRDGAFALEDVDRARVRGAEK